MPSHSTDGCSSPGNASFRLELASINTPYLQNMIDEAKGAGESAIESAGGYILVDDAEDFLEASIAAPASADAMMAIGKPDTRSGESVVASDQIEAKDIAGGSSAEHDGDGTSPPAMSPEEEAKASAEEERKAKAEAKRKERNRKAAAARARKKQDDRAAYIIRKETSSLSLVKMDGDKDPRNLIHMHLRKNDEGSEYSKALKNLSGAPPSAATRERLDGIRNVGFAYLGRTASHGPGHAFHWNWHGSNGHTSRRIMLPGLETRGGRSHAQLTDMSEGEIEFMLGNHLMWKDLRYDELLSHSIDLLFLVIHALRRHEENQVDTTIQFTDTRKAVAIDGQPAAFYPTVELCDIFQVNVSGVWKGMAHKLRQRKFTQEYLSHGVVVTNDNTLQAVKIADLIDAGLFEHFQALEIPRDHRRAGLYTAQVVARIAGYPANDEEGSYSYDDCARVVVLTNEILKRADRLARMFTKAGAETGADAVTPLLHIFLLFLTFERRQTRDPMLIDWLRGQYSSEDVVDLYSDGTGNVRTGFTNVAENLPGVMQYLDLVRDACFVFDLPDLPENVVDQHSNLTGEVYAVDDARLHRKSVASTYFDGAAKLDDRAVSTERRKRKRDVFLASAKQTGGGSAGTQTASADSAAIAPEVANKRAKLNDSGPDE